MRTQPEYAIKEHVLWLSRSDRQVQWRRPGLSVASGPGMPHRNGKRT